MGHARRARRLRRHLLRLALTTRRRWRWGRARLQEVLGVPRRLQVLPMRGYGSPQAVHVRARVLEGRRPPPQSRERGVLKAFWASVRRYVTREAHGVAVRLSWAGREWDAVTDEEGFVELTLTPPGPLSPGWHGVELALESGPSVVAPVLLAGPRADFGVISDLDDTVIATGVTHLWMRMRALLLTDAHVRLPFEGVSAFYLALHQGRSGRAHNPIFYVSSSPWNLYEHLDSFLRLHSIPSGPLLLRDWGLSEQGLAPLRGHAHKLDKMREVLSTYPTLPFLLIGDSGQEDPEHYCTIAREYPGRIRCIYIRRVTYHRKRLLQLRHLAEVVREADTELVLVDDTVTAARHAAERGWIRWDEVEDVREQAARDEAGASPIPAPAP